MVGAADGETKALVQVPGRISGFDEQSYRLLRGICFFDQGSQVTGADSVAAPFGEQGDIDEIDRARATEHIEPADGLCAVADQGEVGALVVLLIVVMLGIELLRKKGIDGWTVPATKRHFLCTGRCVKPAEEAQIGLLGRPKMYLGGTHGVGVLRFRAIAASAGTESCCFATMRFVGWRLAEVRNQSPPFG